MEKQQIFDIIKENPNYYTYNEILQGLQGRTITKEDLLNCGIPLKVIDRLNNVVVPYFNQSPIPYNTIEGYTEVYFWGAPGVGRNSAIAAILNTAERDGLINIHPEYFGSYMARLKNIFCDDFAILPPPLQVESIEYLPFKLQKFTEKQSRYVSFIECSAEVYQCFHYINAGIELPTQCHQQTLDILVKFLKGKNRKIHFFFIDYGKENIRDSNGLTQSDHSNAACTFFRDNNIFGKTTDAIYVVVSKSDLMPCEKDKRVEYAKEYLYNNHAVFINVLKDKCQRYGINAGKLSVIPFSIGNVYFQWICDFDNESSKVLIDNLLKVIPTQRRSFFNIFKN